MKYFLVVAGLLIFALTSMTCHAPTEPSNNSADTTSNDWTFTETMLGGASGSNLYDVAIVNDTDAWAVGEIYQDSSNGSLDPFPYNVAHWNGDAWDISQISVSYQGHSIITPIQGVFPFSPNDIWLMAGDPIHGDGENWSDYDIRSITGNNNLVVYKAWGANSSSLYFAGWNGTLVRYSAGTWQSLSSKTSLILQDIYGSDGTVLAVASDPGESLDKEILKINGTNVTQLSTAGIQWPLSSVWFVPGHYYVVGQGIYEKTSLSQSTWQEDSVDTVDFFSSIRGNAWNDFFVAGGYGQLLHFNGKTWRSYQNVLGLQQGGIASIAVKGNLMIGVGYLGSKAVAFVGKRS